MGGTPDCATLTGDCSVRTMDMHYWMTCDCDLIRAGHSGLSLSQYDDFTGRIYEIYKAVRKEGRIHVGYSVIEY